jgi:AcrR family transcriptional regulator
MAATDRSDPLTGRAAAIRDAARELLERDGPEGLAMRALAEAVGAHPPAVYRHFPDKRAVEAAVVSEGLFEVGDAMLEALEGADDPLTSLSGAYRSWAHEHPHLYRLAFGKPLDVHVDPQAEQHAGKALREVTKGDVNAARAIWASVHGLVSLELDKRFPEGSDLDAIWAFVLNALRDAQSRN